MKIKNLFVITVLAFASPLVTSCHKSESGKPSDVDYYTCTMHPSVRSQDPKAKCPICGMNLVPVMKKQSQSGSAETYACPMHPSVKSRDPNAKCPDCGMNLEPIRKTPVAQDADVHEAPHEFTVPVARQQQIGVTYAIVEQKPLRQTIRTVGIVAYDKQRHWDFVARVEGYVQTLHVSSRGNIVEKDQPLLTIYSPELLTTQREFVDLLKMRDGAKKSGSQTALESAERMIESAKRRLVLWNITSNQIAELEKTREAKDTLTFFSPFKGVVQDLLADQGRRVMTGDHLVDIADLSVVWVWAEFYQEELPLLKTNLPVVIKSSSYPNENFSGNIAVVDPFIDEIKRTGRVRLEIANADFKLRPDMYVDVEIEMAFGEGLTVPVSAVMPTGKRNIVFIDKGEGKLEPRFVKLGKKFGGDYAINSGLTNGERVVNSANFLIDAEAKVQGALSSW